MSSGFCLGTQIQCNQSLYNPDLTSSSEYIYSTSSFLLHNLSDMGANLVFKEYLLFDLGNVQYIAWPDMRVDALAAVRILKYYKCTARRC